MGDGDGRRELCDRRWAHCYAGEGIRANEEDWEVSAEREVREAAIWRAAAVRKIESRALPEVYRCRGSRRGNRTVWSSGGDAARLSWWLAVASFSRLGRRLRGRVDAVAILCCRLLRACGTYRKKRKCAFANICNRGCAFSSVVRGHGTNVTRLLA